MDSGEGSRVDPHIEEDDEMVSVYISSGTGVGNYREFFPETGGMSAWYQRNVVSEYVLGFKNCEGEFLYSIDGRFDYDEVIEKYNVMDISVGVHHDGFVNNADSLIHNSSAAFNRARSELNDAFTYNLVITDYDNVNDMWFCYLRQKR